MTTVYHVTVKYPATPYARPSNEVPLKKYFLENEAVLEYRLKTTSVDETEEDTANIQIGHKEGTPTPRSLTVEKHIEIGSGTGKWSSVLNDAAVALGYSRAKFTLYSDPDYSLPARDINGGEIDEELIEDVETNSSGRVTFANLRYGTYYLKETVIPDGFSAPNEGKYVITLNADGTVTYGGVTQNYATLVNTAEDDGLGIIEFWKLGKTSKDGSLVVLPGVQFGLYRTAGDALVKTATSDASGRVIFHAVEASAATDDYYIQEISLPGSGSNPESIVSEYPLSTVKKYITVEGNTINRPVTDEGDNTSRPSTFVNVSQKGRFEIEKIDSRIDTKGLTGAGFDVYGPYDASVSTPTGAKNFSFTMTSSKYTSRPLEQGYYFLVETRAPEGYDLDETPIKIQIEQNTTLKQKVTNVAMEQVTIHKYGVLQSSEGVELYKTGLNGAVFGIYKTETDADADQDRVATITTRADATGVPVDTGDPSDPNKPLQLPQGTYYYKEISAPGGYTVDATVRSFELPKVEGGEPQYGELVVLEMDNRTNYGQIVIDKINPRNANDPNMANIEFSIYKTRAAAEAGNKASSDYVETIETNAGGRAVSSYLSPGNYFITEDNVPSGYFQEITVIAGVNASGEATGPDGSGVLVKKDEQTTVKVYNNPSVSIRLYKIDEAKKPAGGDIIVNGVVFARYDSLADAQGHLEDNREDEQTVTSGYATFSGLEPGKTYYFREVSVPAGSGYILSDKITTVRAPQASDSSDIETETVTNQHYGKVVVLKKGAFDSALLNLNGAAFVVYPRNEEKTYIEDRAAAAPSAIISLSNPSLGRYESANLTPGNYWLVEDTAPTGYTTPADGPAWPISVTSGMNFTSLGYGANETTIQNVPTHGRVAIKKVIKDTDTGLAATFGVYKKLGPGSYESTATITITTGADGYKVSDLLPADTYGIKEISVGDAYDMDPNYHDVTIEAGKTAYLDNPLKIENTPRGRLSIKKFALWALNNETGTGTTDYREALTGAVFEIYASTGDWTTDQSGPVLDTITIDSASGTLSKYLTAGNYWVYEKTPPTGYDIITPNPRQVTITSAHGATPLELDIDNTPQKSRIKLYKRDLATSALLDGADFELYVVDDGGTDYLVDEGTWVKLTKVSAQGPLQSGTITGETGTALTIEIEPGKTYYLRELPYHAGTNTSPLLGPAGGYEMVKEWWGPITTTASEIASITVHNYQPVTVPGLKNRGPNTSGLGGVWVALFADVTSATSFRDTYVLPELVTEANMQDDDLDNPASFWRTHGIVSAAKSASNGTLSFAGLQPGETYFALEVIGLANYTMDTQIKQVTVKQSTNAFKEPLQIHNYPYGRIRLRKVTELSGVTYGLNDAEFDIFNAKDDGDGNWIKDGERVTWGTTGTDSTDGDGYYLSVLLPPGVYIVEEREAPDGFAAPTPNSWVVTIAQSGATNTDLVTNPIVNTALNGRFILRKLETASTIRLNARFVVQHKVGGVYVDYTLPGGSSVYKITTDEAMNYLTSEYLPAGEYKLTEEWVQDGYTMEGAVVYLVIEGGKITDGSSQLGDVYQPSSSLGDPINPITVYNRKQGSLEIEKLGRWMTTNVRLNGVSFELYDNENFEGTPVRMGTTDTLSGNAGRLVFTELDEGDYYLKETSLGSNAAYEMGTMPNPIHIAPGAPTSLTGENAIVNSAAYGKFSIKKIDPNATGNQGIDKVSFEVYDNPACSTANGGKKVDTITTDDSGVATTVLLPVGTYYLKETTISSEYFMGDADANGIIQQGSSPRAFVVSKNALTDYTGAGDEINNIKKQTVSLYKYYHKPGDGVTKYPVGGAVFRLYDDETEANAASDNHIPPQRTTASTGGDVGYVRFHNLQPNTKYWLVEMIPPTGFKGDRTPIHVETTNSGAVEVEKENEQQGKIKILKQAQWDDGAGNLAYDWVSGAVFDIYDYTGGIRGDQADIINTEIGGYGESGYLDAGVYELVERPLPGYDFGDPTNSFTLTVNPGETNTDYATPAVDGGGDGTSIKNVPTLGRFRLKKVTTGTDTGLTGAVFELRWLKSGQYVIYDDARPTFTMTGDTYTSGMLPNGQYRLIEKTAPAGHSVNPTPLDFTITSGGVTVSRTYENDMQGKIVLTKYGDALNGNPTLGGAEFQLYKGTSMDDAIPANKVQGIKTSSDSDGTCTWENIDGGDYIIVEVNPPEGYRIDTQYKTISVPKGQSTVADATVTISFTNTSDYGRIWVKKIDNPTDNTPLGGAEFDIYSTKPNGIKDQVVGTITTASTSGSDSTIGFGLSDLLKVDDLINGTKYILVETKAPAGYTLDDRMAPRERTVTLMPLHHPDKTENLITFTNFKSTDIDGLTGEVNKRIRDAEAKNSLLIEPFETLFYLDGYADGSNNIPFDQFVLTDNDVKLYYYQDDDPLDKHEMPDKSAEDYRFTRVIIRGARYITNSTDRIDARVQYQMYGSTSWRTAQTVENLQWIASEQDYKIITLPSANIAAVRVEYLGKQEGGVMVAGVGKEFVADGIDLGVTFLTRPGDATKHEVRQVSNRAQLDYAYSEYDEEGNLLTQPGQSTTKHRYTKYSPIVDAEIPVLDIAQTKVWMTISPETNSLGGYFVGGDPFKFSVDSENKSPDIDFVQPVYVFDVPGGTALNRLFGQSMEHPFEITIKDKMGNLKSVWPTKIVYEEVQAQMVNSLGQVVDIPGVKTTRVYMYFETDENGDPFVMEPGDHLKIDFQVSINLDISKEASQLYTPAYLTTSYTLPLSVERPTGQSMSNYYGTGLIENTALDETVNDMTEGQGKNEYINNNAQVPVFALDTLAISKQVKGEKDPAYVAPGMVAETYPGGAVKYRIMMINGTQHDANVARFVDILPFDGDTYGSRNNGIHGRSTDVPERPTLVDVIAPTPAGGGSVTIYYYEGSTSDWTHAQRETQNADVELPMMYKPESGAAWAGWTTSPADMANVTAVGVEVSFDQQLKNGETYTFEIEMKAPEYDHSRMAEYYGKLIANSAMGAILHNQTDTRIKLQERAENVEVLCRMDLPEGSIGDTVWIDQATTGIQELDENGKTKFGVADHGVTLYQWKISKDGTVLTQKKTTTAADGTYLFSNLPCNYLKDPAKEGSRDYMDYVGEVLYVYQVEFDDLSQRQPGQHEDPHKYVGYVPTLQYAGHDRALDSNMGVDFKTEEIILKVVKNAGGDLVGEDNMTIDAGFSKPSSLGDRVWRDNNKNGIQDPGEKGINGVRVNLYRANEDGTLASDQPYRTTLTKRMDGEDGMYLFDKLSPGYYVVEFDITKLLKPSGYSEYSFTKAVDTTTNEDNSKAKHALPGSNERTMRTDLIYLKPESHDPTQDAGLKTYSLLEGYCFDDQGYEDIQDLMIPLPGTQVTLYRVVNNIRETTPHRPTQIVGADGRYSFDHLDEGDYQVHFVYPGEYRAVLAQKTGDPTLDSQNKEEWTPDLKSGYTQIIYLADDTQTDHWDAGARLYGAIGDYVWIDSNKNGIQDPDELGLEGVKVTLQRRKIGSLWEFYEETVTDANGLYIFEHLQSGLHSGWQYRVLFDYREASRRDGMQYQMTITNAGMDPALDSDMTSPMVGDLGYPTAAIDLGYGERDMTWDAGVFTTSGSVGDYVWYDTNKNGIQDEGEEGVADVEVVLEYNTAGDPSDHTAWEEIAKTTTNRSGYYQFNDLQPGYYRVKFRIPDGYQVTQPYMGTGDDAFEFDSDAAIDLGGGWYTTRAFYLEEGQHDMSWDAGIHKIVKQEGGDGPGTGDGFDLWMWVAIVAALALASGSMLLLIRRNKKKKSH